MVLYVTRVIKHAGKLNFINMFLLRNLVLNINMFFKVYAQAKIITNTPNLEQIKNYSLSYVLSTYTFLNVFNFQCRNLILSVDGSV